MMKKTTCMALVMFLVCAALGAAEEKIMFGPYEALVIDQEVIRGVKAEEPNKVHILLNPKYLKQKLIVRISQEEGASYRKWYTGEYDLVSPAGQDKKANDWTDWVETKSKYIEYWMDGRKVLHLKKVK